MVDICLEFADDVIATLRTKARSAGLDLEDYLRNVIESNVPGNDSIVSDEHLPDLSDEPIVQAAEIEKAYRRLGYRYGWRFITCPAANASSAKLLLVSLNPAGRAVHGPAWSQEAGSAYFVESWNGGPPGSARLQRQVQNMFSFLALQSTEVFSAHYVPFRSPSWGELERKLEAESFAMDLWQWLKPSLSFDRITCIGKDRPGRPIARLFDARLEATLPVGWGSVRADRYRLPDGRPLIALPHLSRFALFGRSSGEEQLRELFELA